MPPDSLDVAVAYQNFCNIIRKQPKRPSHVVIETIIIHVGMQSVNHSTQLAVSPGRHLNFGYFDSFTCQT